MKQVHDSKLLMSKIAAQAISGSSNSSRSPTQHLGLGPAKEIALKKYIELQSRKNEPDEYISVFGQLIMEIRQDLGNSNIGLNGDKLTSLFFEISLVADQQDQSSSDDNREVSFGV